MRSTLLIRVLILFVLSDTILDNPGMYDSAKACGIPYFAFGLMEVRASRQTVGNIWEVVVALNVRVTDLTSQVPSGCASVVRQYPGRGADREEALLSALQKTAEEGSRELVDIIRQNCL